MKNVFSCSAVFIVLCCLFSSLRETDSAQLLKLTSLKTSQSTRRSQVPHAAAERSHYSQKSKSNSAAFIKQEVPTNWLAEEARLEKQYNEIVRELNDSCFFYTLVLLQTQKWEKVEAEVKHCMSHREIGEQPMLLRNLGWTQFAQGRYDEAQRTFRKAILASDGLDRKTILEWYLDTLERYDPEDELETVERMLHDLKAEKH